MKEGQTILDQLEEQLKKDSKNEPTQVTIDIAGDEFSVEDNDTFGKLPNHSKGTGSTVTEAIENYLNNKEIS